MAWRHYDRFRWGEARIIKSGYEYDCPFEIGIIATGRQRVFHRYYVKVILPDGDEIIGEDPHNIITALRDVDRQVRDRSIRLVAAGTEPDFYESGLSANTGYGYLPNVDHAVHMMDYPPERTDGSENDKFLEAFIRKAVTRICNRPHMTDRWGN